MLTLTSGRLQVLVALPGEPPCDNFRFSRAGAVTEVILDGTHHFCASEPNHLAHPSSGGRGLMNEFVFDASAQARMGEFFPKLGIGLLRRDREGYLFYKRYARQDVQEFPVSWEQSESSVTFTVEPLPCLGYAVGQKKTLTLADNLLTMQDELVNVGEKEIAGEEYCHNFLTVNGLALGPAYHVKLPGLVDQGFEIISGTIRGEGRGLTFTGYNHDPANFDIPPDQLLDGEEFAWGIYNTEASYRKPGAAGIEVTERFRPGRLHFWCVDHLMSLEVFYPFSLAPGATATWSREYRFEA